ncbi:MAG: hypothetical protein ABID45_03115, partial [Patescibacteria group bacterium]
ELKGFLDDNEVVIDGFNKVDEETSEIKPVDSISLPIEPITDSKRREIGEYLDGIIGRIENATNMAELEAILEEIKEKTGLRKFGLNAELMDDAPDLDNVKGSVNKSIEGIKVLDPDNFPLINIELIEGNLLKPERLLINDRTNSEVLAVVFSGEARRVLVEEVLGEVQVAFSLGEVGFQEKYRGMLLEKLKQGIRNFMSAFADGNLDVSGVKVVFGYKGSRSSYKDDGTFKLAVDTPPKEIIKLIKSKLDIAKTGRERVAVEKKLIEVEAADDSTLTIEQLVDWMKDQNIDVDYKITGPGFACEIIVEAGELKIKLLDVDEKYKVSTHVDNPFGLTDTELKNLEPGQEIDVTPAKMQELISEGTLIGTPLKDSREVGTDEDLAVPNAEQIKGGIERLLSDVPVGDADKTATAEDVDATMQAIRLQKLVEALRKIPEEGPRRESVPESEDVLLEDMGSEQQEGVYTNALKLLEIRLDYVYLIVTGLKDRYEIEMDGFNEVETELKGIRKDVYGRGLDQPLNGEELRRHGGNIVGLIEHTQARFSSLVSNLNGAGLENSEIAKLIGKTEEQLSAIVENDYNNTGEYFDELSEIEDLKNELAKFVEPPEAPNFDQPTSPLGKIGEWDKAYFESRIKMTPITTRLILNVKKLEQFQADLMKISGRVDKLKNAFLAIREKRDHGLDQEFQDILKKDLDRDCEADLGSRIFIGIKEIPGNVIEGGRKKAKSYLKGFTDWMARAEILEERYRTFLLKVIKKENETRLRINDIQNRLMELESGERADYPLVPMLKSDGTEEGSYPELWLPPTKWGDRIAEGEADEEPVVEEPVEESEELPEIIIRVGDIESYLEHEDNWNDVAGARLVLEDGRTFDVIGVERDDFDEDEILVVVRNVEGSEEEFPINILGGAKIEK